MYLFADIVSDVPLTTRPSTYLEAGMLKFRFPMPISMSGNESTVTLVGKTRVPAMADDWSSDALGISASSATNESLAESSAFEHE